MGPSPAAFVRTFDPVKDGRQAGAARTPMDSRQGPGRAVADFAADASGDRVDRTVLHGRRRSFFARCRGRRSSRSRRAPSKRICGLLMDDACPERAGRLLLLPAAVGRQRVQAAESVPALDGAQGRHRPWRLVASSAVATDRPSRYSRHPAGAVPSADALPESGLEDGSGNYLGAARRSNPDDPVRYDFSLCHVGMMNACGFGRSRDDTQCPLRGSCRPRVSE